MTGVAQSTDILGLTVFSAVDPLPDAPSVSGYDIVRLLGRGGMGSVYEAMQHAPPRRVALKLFRDNQLHPEALSRFSIEHMAIARMDHPHVARVYDSGATDTGIPYFAMELVHGLPLTDYCEKQNCSITERIELFLLVCRAVHHAHQKGVIHRDLKPSNILVTEVDGKPAPKVIDFGIAKLLNDTAPDLYLTQVGQITGTPLYMSPEQANPLTSMHLDIRTDVYSLGVILYELLTGTTPMDADSLTGLPAYEVYRRISEQVLTKPSKVVAKALAQPVSTTDRQHNKVRSTLEKELDWIVLHCLEKEPERRYPSADQLAEDLNRFLHHQPVSVGPPSRWYQMRKFIRRNRSTVIVAAMMFTLLTLGVAATAWQAIVATQARWDAEQALQIADQARADEQKMRQLVQERAMEIAKINELLTEVFRDLNPTDHNHGTASLREVIAERLLKVQQELNKQPTGDPTTVGKLRLRLGECLHGLGRTNEAAVELEKAHELLLEGSGAEDSFTLYTAQKLALSWYQLGRMEPALRILEHVLETRKRTHGEEHRDTLFTMSVIAAGYQRIGEFSKSEKFFQQALAALIQTIGPDAPDTLYTQCELAVLYQRQWRFDLSIDLLKKTLAAYHRTVGPNHISALVTTNNLGSVYHTLRWYDPAKHHYEQALEGYLKHFGDSHPSTLQTIRNLAHVLIEQGHPAASLQISEPALKRSLSKLGPKHPMTMQLRWVVAMGWYRHGWISEAVSVFRDLFPDYREVYGPAAEITMRGFEQLVNLSRDRLEPKELVTLLQEHWDLLRKKGHQASSATCQTLLWLGEFAAKTNQWDLVEQLWTQELTDWETSKPDRVTDPMARFSLLRLQHQKYTEAEELLRKLIVLREQRKEHPWLIANARSMLGESLLGQQRYNEAEPLLRSSYEILKQQVEQIPIAFQRLRLEDALNRLIQFARATNHLEDEACWQAERALLPPELGPVPRISQTSSDDEWKTKNRHETADQR